MVLVVSDALFGQQGDGVIKRAEQRRIVHAPIGRVARHARVVVVGAQLVQRYDHRRVRDRIGQGRRRWAAALEAGGQQLGGHFLGGQVSHGCPPQASIRRQYHPASAGRRVEAARAR